ncbi:MAG: nitroreductase family protein [Actinomycetota bacterium]|nr:nitroreductase family protein [Actinomycetota bacterium]
MELYEVMRTTPATRAFRDEPVADEVLYRILDHARFAPSGGNRQGWRVIVVRDPKLRESIRDLYVLGWREYVALRERGLVPFAPTAARSWEPATPGPPQGPARERPDPFADHLHEVPVLLVVCVDLAALAVTDAELDRQSIVGGASVYPFAHNILLAARNEGLGGVMTTVICRQEPQVQQLLSIPANYAIATLIAVGHPRERVSELRRRRVEKFTFVDRFEGEPFSR